MRIKMTQSMAGPTFNAIPGQEMELHDNEAMRLIAAGFAEPLVRGGSKVKWEMRGISPEQYLERFPNGPNADKARKALGI